MILPPLRLLPPEFWFFAAAVDLDPGGSDEDVELVVEEELLGGSTRSGSRQSWTPIMKSSSGESRDSGSFVARGGSAPASFFLFELWLLGEGEALLSFIGSRTTQSRFPLLGGRLLSPWRCLG